MKQAQASWRREVLASHVLPSAHFRYSPVVRVGSFVFLSGMVALDPESGQLIEGDAGAQTAQILANVRALLDEQGWRLGQLVLARIYCADFSAFGLINQAWDAFFGAQEPPARTSVGVAALPLGALVEIEFQLAIEAETAA